MNIHDIKVNPNNYDSIGLNKRYYEMWRDERDAVLDACLSINEYFDFVLGDSYDWGGKYAQFLDDIGIDSNNDAGWWSLPAVTYYNIEYFVRCQNNEDELVKYQNSRDFLKRVGLTHDKQSAEVVVKSIYQNIRK